jgi:hypothetical protein
VSIHKAEHYNLYQRKLLLHYKTPTLQPLGSVWVCPATRHTSLLEEWCLDISQRSTLRRRPAYYTVLPDVPSPPVDSRRCRNYWETHKRFLTHQFFCTRQDCFHRWSGITSARGNLTFENFRLDKVTSEVTAPRQITDVNSLVP